MRARMLCGRLIVGVTTGIVGLVCSLGGGCGVSNSVDLSAAPMAVWIDAGTSDDSGSVSIQARALPDGKRVELESEAKALAGDGGWSGSSLLAISQSFVVWGPITTASGEQRMSRVQRATGDRATWTVPQSYCHGTRMAFDDGVFAWADCRNADTWATPEWCDAADIALGDGTGKASEVLALGGTALFSAIGSQWIVWVDVRNSLDKPWHVTNADIYGVPRGQTRPRPACTATGNQEEPAVDGQWIVWEDHREKASAIYARKLSAGEERRLCSASGGQTDPAISGKWVVWVDYRDENKTGADIWGCDLQTGTARAICAASGDQTSPAISGEWVVWSDGRNASTSGSDIYAFHLASGKEYAVCTDPGDQSYPAVSGR